MRPKLGLRVASWIAGATVIGLVAVPLTSTAAHAARPADTGTATANVVDPATYQCHSSGFVGFENLSDESPLTAGTVPGLTFSASDDWRVGDFGATSGPDAGAKFPAGPFTSEQTHWATASDGSSTVRIDMTNGPASNFTILVGDYSPVSLQAFNHNNKLLTSTPPTAIPDGRHMVQMQIIEPSKTIAYVVIDPGGAPFDVDSICTDAPDVPTPQLFLTNSDGAPKSPTTIDGLGFGKSETVDIAINGCPDGVAATDSSGAFHRSIVICSSVAPGPATIVATGRTSHKQGTANFLVHDDWIQNGFNAGRAADNPFENQINTGNANELTQAWQNVMGGRPTESVIVQGVVYTSSADGAVYAFNDATGAMLWSCVPGQPPCATGGPVTPRAPASKSVSLHGAPVVDNGKLFVDAADGNVYALDPATGDPIWHFKTGRKALLRSPLSKNGILYVGTETGNVYAIHEDTGKKLWVQSMGSAVHSTLAADATNVYVATDSGNLYARNLLTGALAWTGHTGQMIRSSPAVTDGTVFVGSADGKVYVWSAATGHQVWTPLQTGAPVGAAIAVGNGFLYVGTELGTFDKISEATGQLITSYTTGGLITSRAAVANGVVYVGSSTHFVYALDADTLALLWTSPEQSTNITEIAVTNGAVYFGSDTHVLEKFAL